MEPNGSRLYAGVCTECGQGLLGFFMCDDQKTMILLCDECDIAYGSPEDLHAGQPPLIPEAGWIDALGVSYLDGRDATRLEIETKGWTEFVVGSYPYFKNKFGVQISEEKAQAEYRKRLKRQQP